MPYATALRRTYNDLEDQRANTLDTLRTLGTAGPTETSDSLAERASTARP